jgi:signal transduction histidine kinase
MYKKHIKPKAEILLFIVFLDVFFILMFGNVENNSTIYVTFASFFVLILSYFTEFLSKKSSLQEYSYTIFVCIGFPTFSSFLVFNENFKTESIFILFVNLVFFIFYTKYTDYLKFTSIGILLGFLFSFCSHQFYICPSLYKQYFLFVFAIVSSLFIWKTMYRQFLDSLNARETEIEENMTMIVHELSGPLASIKIFATELNKKYREDTYISNISGKIKNYSDLCLFNIRFRKENLRKYKSQKNTENFDIKLFIDECVCSFRETHNEQIEIDIYGVSFILQSNHVFLTTIFSNLLNNSFYFIKKAGKGSILITFEITDKHNVIVFEDTGYGVKPDVLPSIFDKGFSRRRDGTGMGLYMCRELIEHLGGNIMCESNFGEFTRFIIKFPKLTRV